MLDPKSSEEYIGKILVAGKPGHQGNLHVRSTKLMLFSTVGYHVVTGNLINTLSKPLRQYFSSSKLCNSLYYIPYRIKNETWPLSLPEKNGSPKVTFIFYGPIEPQKLQFPRK